MVLLNPSKNLGGPSRNGPGGIRDRQRNLIRFIGVPFTWEGFLDDLILGTDKDDAGTTPE